MKRPQFSIRLMLLVVAMLASIFAWRRSIADRDAALLHMQLESDLATAQFWRAAVQVQLASPYISARQSAAAELPRVDAKITSLRLALNLPKK